MRVFLPVCAVIMSALYVYDVMKEKRLTLTPLEEYACMLAIKEQLELRQLEIKFATIMVSGQGSQLVANRIEPNYSIEKCWRVWQFYQ